MTNTTDTPAALPSRPAAQRTAAAEAARRFILEPFQTQDPEDQFGGGATAEPITLWGVFDVDSRQDGRNGLVWPSGRPEGFLVADTEDGGQKLLLEHQSTYVAELMAAYDLVAKVRAEQLAAAEAEASVPAHQVIRLEHLGGAAKSVRNRFARLNQLVAMYDTAKAEADAAAARLKEITDGIKAETRQAHPGTGDFTITSGALAHPLTLQLVVSRRLDTAAIRKVLGDDQYNALCKDTESWVLKPNK